MKKFAAIILIMTMALGILAGCKQTESNSQKTDAEEGNVQVVCPYVTCESMEELQEQVGFSLTVKDPENFTEKNILAFINTDVKMAEILYSITDENSLSVRKAPGNGDISGDYNEYTLEETADNEIVLKGNKDTGLFHLATWTADGYTYSISSTDGMEKDDMISFAENVK